MFGMLSTQSKFKELSLWYQLLWEFYKYLIIS